MWTNKNVGWIENYITVCEHVQEYLLMEFDVETDEVFDSQLRCGLAYTTLGDDEEFDIQVTLDLKNLRIIKEVTPNFDTELTTCKHIEIDVFEEIEELSKSIQLLNFDELININADYEDLHKAWNY